MARGTVKRFNEEKGYGFIAPDKGGEDGKLLQKVMGHVRYETTANRYIHPSDRATGEAMGRFGGNL